ncbi:MAG TPA: FAD-binding protein [Propionibacteriaceae bacterium]|nr:FAD-binding protein [Propionibacteriaceae bacterium]
MNGSGTTVVIQGATLAGLAAALRLAKAGHRVTLVTGGDPLGGHWAGGDGSAESPVPDSLPQTFALRAAWMDLLRKSGRPFDAELARHRLALVPAPPTVHAFPDGRRLLLPAERGAQYHAVADAFGEAAAERWSALLDDADRLWLALRTLGIERPRPASLRRDQRRAAWAGRTLGQVADRLGEPHLARVVASLGPLSGAADGSAPALLLTRAAIDRQFGLWHLVDSDTRRPQPAGRILEVLRDRLIQRGVQITDAATPPPAPADARLDATALLPRAPFGRRPPRPAVAPAVRRFLAEPAEGDAEGITRVVEHHDDGPVVRWRRPTPDGVEIVEHDHRHPTERLDWGLAPSSWRAWLARPLLGPHPGGARVGTWRASVASPAGNEPWAELLSAALAVYEIHEALTGADIRPTNRDAARPSRPS